MLKQITNIEGLTDFESVELQNDTDPSVPQITFWVKSEEMPAKSAEAGRIVRENYVWIRKIINLGNSILERRIKDKVKFDPATQSWKVLQLVKGKTSDGIPLSDIARYPDAWNHFARSAKEEEIGTPIAILFKNDPARADTYKANYIRTVEQLSACSETHIQALGLGAREDVNAAKAYLARINQLAPSIALDAKLREKDDMISRLQAQLDDLSGKLTQVLSNQIEGDSAPIVEKAKRGRPRKTETFESTEGITA